MRTGFRAKENGHRSGLCCWSGRWRLPEQRRPFAAVGRPEVMAAYRVPQRKVCELYENWPSSGQRFCPAPRVDAGHMFAFPDRFRGQEWPTHMPNCPFEHYFTTIFLIRLFFASICMYNRPD